MISRKTLYSIEPLEARLLFTADVLVSDGQQILELNRQGTIVAHLAVPRPDGAYTSANYVQDLYATPRYIFVFNGAASPYLSTYDKLTGQWSHEQYAGWDSTTAVNSVGLVEADGIEVTDDPSTANGAAASGLVNFTEDFTGTVHRYAAGTTYTDLAKGSTYDTVLALAPQAKTSEQEVVSFNLDTQTGPTFVPLNIVGPFGTIATDASGQIYLTSATGDSLTRYSAAGVLQTYAAMPPHFPGVLFRDMDVADDGTVMLTTTDNHVVLFNANLASSTTFTVPLTAGETTAPVRYLAPGSLTVEKPTAVVSGLPYTLTEGGAITLDGSASTPGTSGAGILRYQWTLDNPGPTLSDDADGETIFYGGDSIDGPKTLACGLTVYDEYDIPSDTVWFTINITNAPPTATFSAGPVVAAGKASTVIFTSADDPSYVDTDAGLKFSYDFNNDGDFVDAGDVANSAVASASYTFARAGTYTVHGRVSDKDGGYTDYKTTVTVTAASATSPAAPSALAATANSGTQVTLTWADNASNETGFEIQRSASSTFSAATTFTAAANATTYVDTTTAKSTYYYYRVRAVNASGDSAYSKSVKIKTLSTAGGGSTGTVLAPPTALSGTAVGGPAVTLNWTDTASGEAGYEIEVSTASSFSTLFKDITVNTPKLATYTVNGLAAKGYYYFRVRAISLTPTLDSAWSNSVKIKTLSA